MPGHALDIDPLPTVNPIGAPGGDFERIQANPEMFGGAIAHALQGFGGAVEKASDTGFNVLQQQRMMQDKTHAAELHSWASDQWSQNSGQFLQLEGKNAVNALPAYKQKNHEILDNIASQADDPYTKLLVQSESRRIMDSHNEMAERHSAAQEKTWQHTTAQLNEASSGNQAVLFATNGDVKTAKKFLFDAGQEARNQADLQGLDRNSADQLVAQKRGQYAYQIVEGLARKEGPGYGPKAALDFYESERNKIDAGSATKIEAFLHSDLIRIAAGKDARQQWADAGHALSRSGPIVRDAISSAAARYGVDLAAFTRTGQVESGLNPRASTGSYHGLFQLSTPEFHKYGPAGGNIWNPVDNADAAAAKMRAEGNIFARNFGRQPTGFDSYMIHQQGLAGYEHHLANPNAPAWQNMLSTGEGQEKGPHWAKAAIWGNIPDQYKFGFGNVNNVTSRDFLAMWQQKFGQGGGAPPQPAATGTGAPPLQPAAFQPAPEAMEAPPVQPTAYQPAVPAVIPPPPQPSWQEKKAFSEAQVLSDPYYQDRPQLQKAILAEINRMADVEHAAGIDNAAAEKAQEKALKVASDAAEIEVMQDAYSPHPKISAAQMLSNPRLSREAKERLLKFYPVNEDRDSDLKHYGPGFFEAYKAVHAPVGDPARITDPAKLYEMTGPGGALTIAGVDKLTAEIYKPKNPETEAETEMKKIFLDSAKRQVSGEGIVPGLKDPKGEEIFLKFLGYFFPAYDKARKEGKTPGELLDPNSKDYLGTSLNTMKRPMAEWYQDSIRDNSQGAAGAPAAVAPPKPVFNPASLSSLDQLKAAVRAGTIDYAQGIQIGLQRGWIRENPVTPSAPSAPSAPQVPISR